MIRRNKFIKRSAPPRASSMQVELSGVALHRSNSSCTCRQGHLHDSVMEADTCDELDLLRRGGIVKDIRRQVTHQLFVGAGLSRCSCQWPKGKPFPVVMDMIYSPRLDFQFHELKCRKDHTQDGTHWDDCWAEVFADTKGWIDRSSAQHVAYKLFNSMHESKIRLYTKHSRRK
jgi:hypothetical protein